VEEKVRFEQYQRLLDHVLASCIEEKPVQDPKQVHPVELAYIGDAVFSLYVRRRLLPVSSHVQVLHDLAARMVSAVMQAKAMDALEGELTEEESQIARRGRNTKSTVPKSASVREYRQGTAFEALMGYLYLMDQKERLHELMDRSFVLIQKAMLAERNKKK
jgi:ribonuclease III family protein